MRIADLGSTWLILLGTAGSPASPESCRETHGTITTMIASPGTCSSPLGLCYTGTLKLQSWLHGATIFSVTSIDNVSPTETTYTGILTVTLRNRRTFTFNSTGTVDLTNDTFQETDVSVPVDDEPTITLVETGTVAPDLSSFQGKVTATLCGPANGESPEESESE